MHFARLIRNRSSTTAEAARVTRQRPMAPRRLGQTPKAKDESRDKSCRVTKRNLALCASVADGSMCRTRQIDRDCSSWYTCPLVRLSLYGLCFKIMVCDKFVGKTNAFSDSI